MVFGCDWSDQVNCLRRAEQPRKWAYRIGIYVACASLILAQSSTPTTAASSLITPGSLPPALAMLNQRMGARMTAAANAQLSLVGTTTDSTGARTATIVIQAPGLLSYRESGGFAVAFDGTSFSTTSGAPTSANEPIMESLLANFPDSVLLQALNGAAIRIVGRHFRTDSGNANGYSGPYWTLIAFAPTARKGLSWGQPLQQEVFLAIDEKTGLLAEVRRVVQIGHNPPQVTQTQFLQWTQQGDQWFPSQIVRLDAGKQTLSFAVQSASVGVAVAATVFQP
jgi:hypothetical protein